MKREITINKSLTQAIINKYLVGVYKRVCPYHFSDTSSIIEVYNCSPYRIAEGLSGTVDSSTEYIDYYLLPENKYLCTELIMEVIVNGTHIRIPYDASSAKGVELSIELLKSTLEEFGLEKL